MSVRTTNNRYLIDTRWPDGQRTRTVIPDLATATKINKKIEVACADEDRIWQRLRRELRLDGSGVCTFAQLADQYLEQYVKNYNQDVLNKRLKLAALKTFFASHGVEQISQQAIAGLIGSKRKEGVKNATINRYLGLLRHMFNWAVLQGIIEVVPFGRIEKLKEVEWVGTRPDEAVIDAIFARLDSRILPIFVFMRETGCRCGEARQLALDSVDFARQVVTFHGRTKSGRSRQVPLTDRALWAVQAMPVQGSTIFYHPSYLAPWTGDGLGWFWDRARGESKLRIHDLRHAYAIRLAEEGCPMHFISEVLGHHSVEFTRRRYARFSPESASRAVLRVLQGRKAVAGGAQNGQC